MNNTLFQFEALGIPVFVTGSSALLLLFLGLAQYGLQLSPQVLVLAALFAVMAFVSVLVHELGHALAGRRLGRPARQIVFTGMGGRCDFDRRMTPWHNVLISLAGPAAGLCLGVLALAVQWVLPPAVPYAVHVAVSDLVWINFAWSLFNLLPIFPMDGGQVLAGGLQLRLRPATAWRITQVVSLGLAVALAVAAFAMGQRWMAAVLLFITMENLRITGRL